ncbi:MAG: biotin--[acetyl-CoA-carboxylase] ligase [Leptolyngbya sp. SIO4C1]|nr:biotin--[acetyl-CoA-carboxylase] ligase [Leptolyngbya sp. SIO4C1]
MSTALDCQKIQQGLTAYARRDLPFRALRPQFQLLTFETLPSTNAELWRRVEQGTAAAGTAAIALTQTAGRGQRGKTWLSTAGGLYLSLLLEPDWPLAALPQLTLCSAWGIASQLNALSIPAQIKWPNDLVVAGRKLGGILTETRLSQAAITHAVIGVGLNWQNSVPPTGITLQQVLTRRCLSAPACLEELAAIVLRGLWEGICYRQQIGSAAFMKHYQNLLMHRGQSVSLGGNTGSIVGVSETGRLQVRLYSDHTLETAQLISFQPGEFSLGYNNSGLDSLV